MSNPFSVAIADRNADDKPGLATASATVLLGNGTGPDRGEFLLSDDTCSG
ncbi:MAG: hypothetical protein JWQ48_1669 [Conexibacter sp.]|nr:hypothetical protein [Conexibacter sp.]